MKTAVEWMDERLAKTVIREQCILWMRRLDDPLRKTCRHYGRRLEAIDGKPRALFVALAHRDQAKEMLNMVRRSK